MKMSSSNHIIEYDFFTDSRRKSRKIKFLIKFNKKFCKNLHINIFFNHISVKSVKSTSGIFETK